MYDYLNRVRALKYEYERAKLKVEELETLATHITTQISSQPKAAAGYGHSDETWAMLIDYKAKYTDFMTLYLAEAKILEEELEVIRNPGIRTAMRYRYVDCMKIEDIADAMGYAVSWVDNMLGRGRKIYREAYKDEEVSNDTEPIPRAVGDA